MCPLWNIYLYPKRKLEQSRFIPLDLKLFPFRFVLLLNQDLKVVSLKINLYLEIHKGTFTYPNHLEDYVKYFIKEIYIFFQGKSPYLDLPHSLSFSGFSCEVLKALREIPRGETLSYKTLAERLGQPRALRAVGQILAKNPLPLIYPCHRVVSQKGLGGYSQGVLIKRLLLYLERSIF
uniref:methylated-DNA--[protein]-cysteine S-methyltransferase n=1 Tax=Caldimicrobium thiodismutans TaxID=1653476 RepID=A0A832LWV9_9BACT